MAKREKGILEEAAKAAAKEKRARKARRATSSVKGVGEMPDVSDLRVSDTNYGARYTQAMTWVHMAFEPKDLREEFYLWAEGNNIDMKPYARLKKDDYFTTLGTVAWIANQGGELADSTLDWIDRKLIELSGADEDDDGAEKPKKPRTERLSPREYAEIKAKQLASELVSDLEDLAMTGDVDSTMVINLLRKHTVKPGHMNSLIERAALIRGDGDIVEREYLGDGADKGEKLPLRQKQWARNHRQKWDLIINALNQYKGIAKNVVDQSKVKKQRKKKDKPAGLLVSKLSYKKNDTTFNLASINPEKILGAKGMLVFNTVYNKVGLFVAATVEGLSVKGSTIKGFDEAKSITKKVRNTKKKTINQVLSELTDTTFIRAGKLLEELSTTESPLKGRVNEDVVLLKVW